MGRNDKRAGGDGYMAFLRRSVRVFARRAAEGELDAYALTQLMELSQELDAVIEQTVVALRAQQNAPLSWQEVADATGLPRATVARRWGAASSQTAVRRVGSQPLDLR